MGELGPTLHSSYSQAVPAPPLAGARVQPDKDGLLFYIKKSIIPCDVPAIGKELPRHQLAGGVGGQGRGLPHLGLPSLPDPHLAAWWGQSMVDFRPSQPPPCPATSLWVGSLRATPVRWPTVAVPLPRVGQGGGR